MPVQYRQIPDEAVKAIVCRDVFWQYQRQGYEREHEAIFSQATDSGTPPVVSISVSVSTDHEFNVSTSAENFITTTNSDVLLESMISNLSAANLLLDEILRLEKARASALQFEELAAKWKKSKYKWSSRSGEIAQDPNYMRIVGMGPAAVPHILQKMQTELQSGGPDHWFYALWSITGENPVEPQHRGAIREMARDWIKWGVNAGLIDGGGLDG